MFRTNLLFTYNIVCKMSKVLCGKEDNIKNLNLLKDMTGNNVLYFKYASLIQ